MNAAAQAASAAAAAMEALELLSDGRSNDLPGVSNANGRPDYEGSTWGRMLLEQDAALMEPNSARPSQLHGTAKGKTTPNGGKGLKAYERTSSAVRLFAQISRG